MSVYLIEEPCNREIFSTKRKAADYIHKHYPEAIQSQLDYDDKSVQDIGTDAIVTTVNKTGYFTAEIGNHETVSIRQMEVV